ncbi:aminoimidazole riboside kinase [Salmonella sp. NCTC 11881]|nr:aminoimidazole riboside kinase [Salmonella sp. NCTC 11881]
MKAMNKVWVIGDASVDLVPEKTEQLSEMPRRSVGERGGMRCQAGRRVRFYWLSW